MKNPIPNPEYGDLMTLEEFRRMVEAGFICSDDGSGYYSNGSDHSDDPDPLGPDPIPAWATHVLWFNK